MAVVYRSVATAGSASPITVTKPTGVVAGDLLLLQVGCQADATVTPPSGFVLVPDAEIAGTTSVRVYAKTAGGSEPADYAVAISTGNGQVGMLALYSDLAEPLVVDDVANQSNATSTDREYPSVTTTVADTVLACFGTMSISVVSAPPGGMTERWDTGASPRIYLMTQSVAGIGATGTRTATNANPVASKCVTIAVAEDTGPADLVSPTDGAADASDQQELTLTWVDANSEFEAMEIYRSPDNVTFAYLDEVAPGVEEYIDLGLQAGTEFWYKVRARRAD